jgi:hypothetical protein
LSTTDLLLQLLEPLLVLLLLLLLLLPNVTRVPSHSLGSELE